MTSKRIQSIITNPQLLLETANQFGVVFRVRYSAQNDNFTIYRFDGTFERTFDFADVIEDEMREINRLDKWYRINTASTLYRNEPDVQSVLDKTPTSNALAVALSPALTDAESIANAEQPARSIPHAIEATLAPVSITEEILTATDSYLTLATNIDDIAAIYEAQDGLAEIVEDAKPLKPRTAHDLAIGVWHSMEAGRDLLAPHGLLIRYCKVHGLEYRDVRAQLVYDVSKNNPAGYTRKEHNLTEHEVKEFIRAVDQFTSQAPAVTVQG